MIFNCFVDRSWSDIVVSVRGKPVTLQDREDNLLPGLQNQHHSMHNIICASIVLMPASSTFSELQVVQSVTGSVLKMTG